jgi:hypothetical protein
VYYKLDSQFPMTDDNTYFDIDDGITIDGIASWARGEPLTATPPNPIVIAIEKIGEADDDSLRPIAFNDANLCIATPEIVNALIACGVNNIQTYPAILKDVTTEREYPYFAINIIGLVKAADLKKSDWINLDGEARMDTVFIDLALDKDKIRGFDLFRLYEDTGTIIISEKVKKALENFADLTFLPVTAA